MQGKFRYLNIGLGVILAFVGLKMLLIGEPFEVHLPTFVSLTVIGAVIAAAVIASLRADARDHRAGLAPPTSDTMADAASADEAGGVDTERQPTGHSDASTREP
jgi:tellurite resistance protein TerC